MKCPNCGKLNRTAVSNGLGGRWKMLCGACAHVYDESEGDREPASPETDTQEEVSNG